MGADPPMTAEFRCPACGSTRARINFRDGSLTVLRCKICGYRLARHAPLAIDRDYHEQYEQGAFLDSLADTRRRQSSVILQLIGRHVSQPDRLLDYGTGRGWFLEACRAAGMRAVAGAETSNLAVESLHERGYEALLVPPVEDPQWLAPLVRLSFRPRILTLLDVIEHLPPDRLQAVLHSLIKALQPELELIVIKVPDSSGLFYRTAAAGSRLGLRAPIAQLYQVGTEPPHRSYFNRRSLVALLARVGLDIAEIEGDRDFEPQSLSDRVPSLRSLPGWMTSAAGVAAAVVAERAHATDSLIVAARPSSS